MTPRTLEDLDNAKRDLPSMERGRTPTGKGKGAGKYGAKSSGQGNAQKIHGQCWNSGKQVISRMIAGKARAATESRPSSSPGKGNDVKGRGKKGKPQMMEPLV